jgi:hypothetical protein
MNKKELFSREVQLSNGTRLPASAASILYAQLQGLHANSHQMPQWGKLLFHLREAALEHGPVPQELVPVGMRLRLLEPNGKLASYVKEMVLASVHGVGGGLFVLSPYTSRVDRTIAELAYARHSVRTCFPPEVAELLLRSDDWGDANTVTALQELEREATKDGEGPQWASAARHRRQRFGLPPPPSRN